jgi:hypothetical protein
MRPPRDIKAYGPIEDALELLEKATKRLRLEILHDPGTVYKVKLEVFHWNPEWVTPPKAKKEKSA